MSRLTRLCLFAIACTLPASSHSMDVSVTTNAEGKFTLLREGKPYFVRGAGGSSHLSELVAHGGNSIRTWGIETLEQEVDGKPLIDRCEELGISIAAGIWIRHERHGFDYSDADQVSKQREEVRSAIRKYKDHPAILMWSLGNEMEGPDSDDDVPHIWKELNHLAEIVKSEDSTHPVMTVIAGASETKIRGIMEHYPNIDILGVNSYAAASSVAGDVTAAGWTKPFMLTEFGPSGHWEVPKTSWGAAIEPSSRDKAESYFVTQSLLLENASDICVGSYCFLWGHKQEKTPTWYGMFLPSGEKLPQVDVMSRLWTGEWPDNRCPRVSELQSELAGATVKPGVLVKARVVATDPNQDSLKWHWVVMQESEEASVGGDHESVPPSFPDCIVRAENGGVEIRTPDRPGNYRLFVVVRDGRGGACADNLCFRVSAE